MQNVKYSEVSEKEIRAIAAKVKSNKQMRRINLMMREEVRAVIAIAIGLYMYYKLIVWVWTDAPANISGLALMLWSAGATAIALFIFAFPAIMMNYTGIGEHYWMWRDDQKLLKEIQIAHSVQELIKKCCDLEVLADTKQFKITCLLGPQENVHTSCVTNVSDDIYNDYLETGELKFTWIDDKLNEIKEHSYTN